MTMRSISALKSLLGLATLCSTTTAFAPAFFGTATRTLSLKSAVANSDETFPVVDSTTDKVASNVSMPLAPHLTLDKYMKMQDKRVVVAIQYSGESGLNPYFLTVAKKVKETHPDVIIEKRIMPTFAEEAATFEIIVDDKVVVGKKSTSRQRLGSTAKGLLPDLTGGMSVFVSMMEIDLSISKARRRRRPNTMYGKDGEEHQEKVKLEQFRRGVGDDDDESWMAD